MKVEAEFKKDIPMLDGDKKEMFSVFDYADGSRTVRVNFSSVDSLQTCMRKAQFMLDRKLQKNSVSPPLVFGSGIHRAMEVWYTSERQYRRIGSIACDDNQSLIISGAGPISDHGPCPRCASVFAFFDSVSPRLGEAEGARSPENGVAILNNYFDYYLDDPYDLVVDSDGPMCEREFEFEIYSGELDGKQTSVMFFGTIDSVFRNRETGEIILVDHKTGSSLGSDFLNRIKPNHQFAGYWWALEKVFGIQPSRMMVNGIQVAKTKMELNRQFTTISKEEIAEVRGAVLYWVEQYLIAKRREFWPMSSPSACSMWGGCQYKRVCELPRALQESVIKAEYV